MLELIVSTVDSIAFYALIILLTFAFIGAVFYVIMKNLRGF